MRGEGLLRAAVFGGLLAWFVLFIGYLAPGAGLDGPCLYYLAEPPLQEGTSISTDVAWWPPGAVKCVTELPSGRIREETFPRDGYWVAAFGVGLVPLLVWALWLRGTSPRDWTRPWQRVALSVAGVALPIFAAGFAAFSRLFFALLWVAPPMRDARLALLEMGQGPSTPPPIAEHAAPPRVNGLRAAPYHSAMSARAPVTASLPGNELVEQGLGDLRAGRETPVAALVSMAAPRLRDLGIEVPPTIDGRPSHRLYDLLCEEDPGSAHSRYNALVARIASFARAAEHARAG